MKYLLDTSVLARLANGMDARYPIAGRAVLELHRRGDELCVTPQVLRMKALRVDDLPDAAPHPALSRREDCSVNFP